MNGTDILWALSTLLSVILFISGDRLVQRKIRLLNYVSLTTGVIYLAEVLQTLQNLGKMGYPFRMLAWTTQASSIIFSLYRVWIRPWLISRRCGVQAMSVVFAVALMSCLVRLVL